MAVGVRLQEKHCLFCFAWHASIRCPNVGDDIWCCSLRLVSLADSEKQGGGLQLPRGERGRIAPDGCDKSRSKIVTLGLAALVSRFPLPHRYEMLVDTVHQVMPLENSQLTIVIMSAQGHFGVSRCWAMAKGTSSSPESPMVSIARCIDTYDAFVW